MFQGTVVFRVLRLLRVFRVLKLGSRWVGCFLAIDRVMVVVACVGVCVGGG